MAYECDVVYTDRFDVLGGGAMISLGHGGTVLCGRHGFDDSGQVPRFGDVVRSVVWNAMFKGAMGGRRNDKRCDISQSSYLLGWASTTEVRWK